MKSWGVNRVRTSRFPSWWSCWKCRQWPLFRLALALWHLQCFGTWFSFCVMEIAENQSDQLNQPNHRKNTSRQTNAGRDGTAKR